MVGLDSMHEYLKKTLSDKRYIHSVNTAETAVRLAKLYGVSEDKAYVAGLIHDCTREAAMDTQIQMLHILGYEVDELTKGIRELLHAYTAEYVMKQQFCIEDQEIISAVRFHTTGSTGMSMLEKVIFLSDVIEPSRSFPGVDYIRQLSVENIDEALLAAFDSSIRFLTGKRAMIHPNTVFARNDLLGGLRSI